MKVYVVNEILFETNEYLISYFYDSSEHERIEIDKELLFKEGDFIYQDNNGEWLLVDAFPYLLAEKRVKDYLKTSKEYKEANKTEYEYSLTVMKEYLKDPGLLNKEETKKFLNIRNEKAA